MFYSKEMYFEYIWQKEKYKYTNYIKIIFINTLRLYKKYGENTDKRINFLIYPKNKQTNIASSKLYLLILFLISTTDKNYRNKKLMN